MGIEQLRHFRFGPFTYFDTLTAYVGIFLIAPLLTKLFSKFHIYIKRTEWLWLTLPIALTFHFALKLDTPFKQMFLNPAGYYFIPQIVILFMLFMGLRNSLNPNNLEP